MTEIIIEEEEEEEEEEEPVKYTDHIRSNIDQVKGKIEISIVKYLWIIDF